MPGGPLAIYALTADGARQARRLAEVMGQGHLFLPERLARARQDEKPFSRLGQALGQNFRLYEGHVLFAAAGIVVRLLAGMLESKASDPAVVVVDPAGRWAVSLLAGHLGGANRLAQEVARALGGQAVITTASDSAGLPSLEVLARGEGMAVENLPALARLSRRMLEGRPVRVYDPGGWLHGALAAWPEAFEVLPREPGPAQAKEALALVSHGQGPFPASWLLLRPPCLVAGVGCNRGTGAQEIIGLLKETFAAQGWSLLSLAALATVELKRDEVGLVQAAGELGVGLRLFSAAELEKVAVPNPSDMVRRHVGVRSVCEAAALAASKGRLLIGKQKTAAATLAVALAPAESSG